VDDGGEDIYRQFAREEAADRRGWWGALAAAAAVHLLLLVTPLPWAGGAAPQVVPSTPAPFRLRELRFAPPRPPPTPPAAEVTAAADEPSDSGPPPAAAVDLLVPSGPAGGLVPPQPLVTPPPPFPEELWRRGLGGEVVLTLVVDTAGEVAEVTVEEVTVGVGEGGGENVSGEPVESSAAFRDAVGRAAAEAARHWVFLPGSLAGNPISCAISVRVRYPAPPPPAGSEGRVPGSRPSAGLAGSAGSPAGSPPPSAVPSVPPPAS